MSNVPSSTGIGAPGTNPAPASLARSPMASTAAPAASTAIPFVRGASLATMQDFSTTFAAAGPPMASTKSRLQPAIAATFGPILSSPSVL